MESVGILNLSIRHEIGFQCSEWFAGSYTVVGISLGVHRLCRIPTLSIGSVHIFGLNVYIVGALVGHFKLVRCY